MVLFIMLYKVVLTFCSMDEILKCDHSNDSYGAIFFCGTVICMPFKAVVTSESMSELLECDNSDER